MNLKKNKFLVFGLGKTGIETSKFLYKKSAEFIAVDSQPLEKLSSEVNELIKKGVTIETDYNSFELFEWADIVILSPGISFNHQLVKKAIEIGKKVISEIEFSSYFISIPIIGITGTNGKTTTTSLISEILMNSGKKVFTGGNIGIPLITIADNYQDFDLALLELSSFQLQGTFNFSPLIGLILNISENHLDHHINFTEYVDAKMKLFQNHKAENWSVFNINDPIIREKLSIIRSKKITFGDKANNADIHLDSKKLFLRDLSFNLDNIKLLGAHNIENIMASIAVAFILGVESQIIQETIDQFKPLPHRIEYISTIKGVKIYNDSKSTSPDATLKALESLDPPIILVAGGKDKETSFETLKETIKCKVKHLILIGESKARMKAELQQSTLTSTAESLEEAVNKAIKSSNPNDTLLFSPACSSFDMFKSYEERGRKFKEIVQNI
ncbi:MAG: UDP-N-acetylmuramoyl-L-alanine--D-glutamate ligase [Thermodesulfobacteriota bacterium]